MKDEPLTIAEQEAVKQLRRWPTLYKSANDFFHQSVISGQGSYYWKKGLLVSGEKRYISSSNGKNKYGAYPFEISENVAKRLLNNNASGFPSVYPSGHSPIDSIPDDAHKDWLKFISHHLYMDEQITPDLYIILVQAMCIRHYRVVENPRASHSHFINEWNKYHAKIPSYKARIRLIEQTREQGQIPPDRYMGIDI